MTATPNEPSKPKPRTEPATTTAPAPRPQRVRQVPAVTRSIAILRMLGRAHEPIALKAIAAALGLVPSTCLHILRVLVAEELVKVDAGKRYELGSGMLSLARSVIENSGFARLVQPVLERIATARGTTVMGLEITAQRHIVVLAISRPQSPFRLHTDVGARFDTLTSATGRLIAAHGQFSPAELRKKFKAIDWDRPIEFDAWKAEVELARRQAYAVDRDHFLVGVTVVAVPIFGVDGTLTYAIAAAGLSDHLNEAATAAIAREIQDEARVLSRLLI